MSLLANWRLLSFSFQPALLAELTLTTGGLVSGYAISATLPCDWSLWYSGEVNAANASLKDAAEYAGCSGNVRRISLQAT
jgi:hypothetical protein